MITTTVYMITGAPRESGKASWILGCKSCVGGVGDATYAGDTQDVDPYAPAGGPAKPPERCDE